jgi:hypothetical protein
LGELDRAQEIAWADHWMGHDLAVRITDNEVRHFGVTRPEKRK